MKGVKISKVFPDVCLSVCPSYTGCPNKFGMAQTAGVAEVVISASKSGTQGGYTMVPWPPA